ncbi:hypothetical protein [Rhizobium wuzhouense]|uniref:Uncharacterized protein n=1 Tax=Rhizobium wuzhouense TaxID=1986026 RepID=A0ABX5NPE0_9HYPH|nr:hypothetical protein [Rhizobium wuzhouense]PYB72384.1 hypothetical protein DMY87_14710 [Rhizobium wuzhouense]
MAYIEILPKSSEAQQTLFDDSHSALNLLFEAVKETLEVPDHDIIVELNQCTVLAFNATAVKAGSAPDVVIKIATSDHDLQPRFQTLSDQIVAGWNAHFGSALKMELWIGLIDTWGCNIQFDDSVDMDVATSAVA